MSRTLPLDSNANPGKSVWVSAVDILAMILDDQGSLQKEWIAIFFKLPLTMIPKVAVIFFVNDDRHPAVDVELEVFLALNHHLSS